MLPDICWKVEINFIKFICLNSRLIRHKSVSYHWNITSPRVRMSRTAKSLRPLIKAKEMFDLADGIDFDI